MGIRSPKECPTTRTEELRLRPSPDSDADNPSCQILQPERPVSLARTPLFLFARVVVARRPPSRHEHARRRCSTAAEPPSLVRTPLPVPHRLSECSSASRMPFSSVWAKSQAKPCTGAPFWLSPVRSPPRNSVPARTRRRPHPQPPVAARSRINAPD